MWSRHMEHEFFYIFDNVYDLSDAVQYKIARDYSPVHPGNLACVICSTNEFLRSCVLFVCTRRRTGHTPPFAP